MAPPRTPPPPKGPTADGRWRHPPTSLEEAASNSKVEPQSNFSAPCRTRRQLADFPVAYKKRPLGGSPRNGPLRGPTDCPETVGAMKMHENAKAKVRPSPRCAGNRKAMNIGHPILAWRSAAQRRRAPIAIGSTSHSSSRRATEHRARPEHDAKLGGSKCAAGGVCLLRGASYHRPVNQINRKLD